jgi:hypothetical protein
MCCVTGPLKEPYPSDLRKLRQKSLLPAIETCMVRAGHRNRERLIDEKLPCPQLHAGWHGHEVDVGVNLSDRGKGEYQEGLAA